MPRVVWASLVSLPIEVQFMARPFIEFLQSQAIGWRPDPARPDTGGVSVKLLSEDAEDGAATMLVRFAPDWRAPPAEWCAADEEFFVLTGSVTTNTRHYTAHHYAYWPGGFLRQDFAADPVVGATILLCSSATRRYCADATIAPAFDTAALTEQVDSFKLAWDRTNMDPNIAHLNAWRKNLRLAPDGSGRSYLLAGLPQGYPASGEEPLERHPHIEEMFMIAGDMPCSLGIMRAGAYFWRPPMIWHGADCTLNGFLLFARTPGTNQTVSEWADVGHPVTMTPAHAPRLPEHLAAAGVPIDDPVAY